MPTPAPPQRVRAEKQLNASESFAHATQTRPRGDDARVIAGDVADDDVGVAERGELGEALDDLVDGAGDEGRRWNAAIAGGKDLSLDGVGVGRRVADVDVAADRDGLGRAPVGLAALEVERGLVACLVDRERR